MTFVILKIFEVATCKLEHGWLENAVTSFLLYLKEKIYLLIKFFSKKWQMSQLCRMT